ncbi:MAG: PRC-barrel domain-containing protein [Chloroflexota bacterium]|nr:PRC-barrel domain-containing protein [Chloroflexota bacterium]
MRVELGTHVLTSDGKDVGKIEKLVVDPNSGTVRLVVVRKGLLLPRDVEIRVEELRPGEDGRVHLSYTAEQVDRLPEFVESEYTAPTAGYESPLGYPADSLVWSAGYAPTGVPTAGYTPPQPTHIPEAPDRATTAEIEDFQLNRDLTNAVIEEGDAVLSRDGDKVGEVHSVTFDVETRRPTRLVVRKGFLFTEDVELPWTSIDGVDDGTVYLTLSKSEVERAAREHRPARS